MRTWGIIEKGRDLAQAVRNQQRAVTVEGQIKSATTEAAAAVKIHAWERLIGKDW